MNLKLHKHTISLLNRHLLCSGKVFRYSDPHCIRYCYRIDWKKPNWLNVTEQKPETIKAIEIWGIEGTSIKHWTIDRRCTLWWTQINLFIPASSWLMFCIAWTRTKALSTPSPTSRQGIRECMGPKESPIKEQSPKDVKMPRATLKIAIRPKNA